MKVFRAEEQAKKSWSIGLKQDMPGSLATLSAVDSATGKIITTLIMFWADGNIQTVEDSKDMLIDAGYDPHEHGNTFDAKGRLIVVPRIFADDFGTESADYVVKTDGPNEPVVRYRDLVSVLEA